MGVMFVPTALAYNIVLAPSLASLQLPKLTVDMPQKAPESLQEKVYALAREYNQDPVLAYKIITCEGLRYKTDGNNHNVDKNGNIWSIDVGPWQINNYYHEVAAHKLGLDIYDLDENLRYGFILLSTQGTKPWLASRYCWNK